MDTHELRLSVIHEILSVSQREIHDVHAVHLPHLLVAFPPVDIFRHQLGSPEEHPLEIRKLIVVLHLDEHQFSLRVFCQHVHPVVLVKLILLVAFAFQQFVDGHLFLQQCGEQSFQHRIVGLVAQQTLHGPVKTNITFHRAMPLFCSFYKGSKFSAEKQKDSRISCLKNAGMGNLSFSVVRRIRLFIFNYSFKSSGG